MKSRAILAIFGLPPIACVALTGVYLARNSRDDNRLELEKQFDRHVVRPHDHARYQAQIDAAARYLMQEQQMPRETVDSSEKAVIVDPKTRQHTVLFRWIAHLDDDSHVVIFQVFVDPSLECQFGGLIEH